MHNILGTQKKPKHAAYVIAIGTTVGGAVGAVIGLIIRGIIFAIVNDAEAGFGIGVVASVGMTILL